jgi:hypothetical protein
VRKFGQLWQGCMSSGYRLSIWCGAEEIQGNLKNKIDIRSSPYRAVNTPRL